MKIYLMWFYKTLRLNYLIVFATVMSNTTEINSENEKTYTAPNQKPAYNFTSIVKLLDATADILVTS